MMEFVDMKESDQIDYSQNNSIDSDNQLGDEILDDLSLPCLSRDIHILTANEEIANLTPLHIAIQKKRYDIVKYIITQMQVDLRMTMTIEITNLENIQTV